MLLLGACLLLLQSFLGAAQAPVDVSHLNHVTKRNMTLPLDHLNKTDERTFNIEYFETLDYFKPGGPIFVILTAFEFELSYSARLIGSTNFFYSHLANITNGALFVVRLRYTWHSEIPNANMSSFEYMTTEQSLHDVAAVVQMLRARPEFAGSKVVMAGSKYAANLAVWFRARYPNLADAAYASGAPLLAKAKYPEYYETAGKIIKSFDLDHNSSCYDDISDYFKYVKHCVKLPNCTEELIKPMKICNSTDLSLKVNQQAMYNFLANLKTDMLEQYGVNGLCFDHSYMSPTETAAGCHIWFDFKAQIERYNKDIKSKAIFYPMCTEFGHMAVTSSDSQPFGQDITYDYRMRFCSELFGIDAAAVEANVARTNSMYGGLKPNVTRVLFVMAEQDLMQSVQVTSDLSPEAPVYVIPGAIPYGDIFVYEDFFSNVTEVKKAREFVISMLQKWLTD